MNDTRGIKPETCLWPLHIHIYQKKKNVNDLEPREGKSWQRKISSSICLFDSSQSFHILSVRIVFSFEQQKAQLSSLRIMVSLFHRVQTKENEFWLWFSDSWYQDCFGSSQRQFTRLNFFCHVGPGDHTQVVRVGIMHCYSRSQQQTVGFPCDWQGLQPEVLYPPQAWDERTLFLLIWKVHTSPKIILSNPNTKPGFSFFFLFISFVIHIAARL